MAENARIWPLAVLSAAFVSLLLGAGALLYQYGWLKVEVAFAEEQTEIFEAMRTQARAASDAKTAADCLNYVVNYYPSGSKQQTGSRLDTIVERARAIAKQEIIADLRARTGENLGDDPQVWIEKYARQ